MNVKRQITVAILAPTLQDLLSVAAEVATFPPWLLRLALVSLNTALADVALVHTCPLMCRCE